MRSTALAVLLLLAGAPAFAGPPVCSSPDTDGDTVLDCNDNCSDVSNASQLDADADLCGNVCDGDFDQNGLQNISDFSDLAVNGFGKASSLYDVAAPHSTTTGGGVNIGDFSAFAVNLFGKLPGPSGTTTGTTACP